MYHTIYTPYLYFIQQLASITSSVKVFRGPIDQKSMKTAENSSLNNNEQKYASLQIINYLFKEYF